MTHNWKPFSRLSRHTISFHDNIGMVNTLELPTHFSRPGEGFMISLQCYYQLFAILCGELYSFGLLLASLLTVVLKYNDVFAGVRHSLLILEHMIFCMRGQSSRTLIKEVAVLKICSLKWTASLGQLVLSL
jgi:hypothetical protein